MRKFMCWECGRHSDSARCRCGARAKRIVPRTAPAPRRERMAQGGWPLRCWALGCAPQQVREFQRMADQRGLDVKYLKNGDMEVPSRSEYAKVLKAHGKVNLDAYYGRT